VAAATARERVAAQTVLADVPLSRFLEEPIVPYEDDEVTRLILDDHDPAPSRRSQGLPSVNFVNGCSPMKRQPPTLRRSRPA